MGVLDTVKKYECPIDISCIVCESGWTYVAFDLYGTVMKFDISYLGYQPSALLEATRIFLSHEDSYEDGYCYRHIDIKRTEDAGYWYDVPMVVEFQWDEEPRLNDWKFSREAKDMGEEDFPVKIEINRRTAEEVKHTYIVRYRDLCYAVARYYTEMLKRYGFLGYYHGSYGDDINLRQLLEVKGYALGLTDNLYVEDGYRIYRLRLTPEEELALLKLDM